MCSVLLWFYKKNSTDRSHRVKRKHIWYDAQIRRVFSWRAKKCAIPHPVSATTSAMFGKLSQLQLLFFGLFLLRSNEIWVTAFSRFTLKRWRISNNLQGSFCKAPLERGEPEQAQWWSSGDWTTEIQLLSRGTRQCDARTLRWLTRRATTFVATAPTAPTECIYMVLCETHPRLAQHELSWLKVYLWSKQCQSNR